MQTAYLQFAEVHVVVGLNSKRFRMLLLNLSSPFRLQELLIDQETSKSAGGNGTGSESKYVRRATSSDLINAICLRDTNNYFQLRNRRVRALERVVKRPSGQ